MGFFSKKRKSSSEASVQNQQSVGPAAAKKSKERSHGSGDGPFRVFFFCWVLPCMFLAGALAYAGWSALGFVRQLPQFQVNADRLILGNRPDWLSRDTERSINRKHFREATYSIFDSDLTEKIRLAYRDDPWVLRVESVSKHFPNSVLVKLTLRRPLAQAVQGSQSYVIDIEGRVLEAFDTSAPFPYSRITKVVGVESKAPSVGELWSDDALRGAVGAAMALDEKGLLEPLALATIDVSNFGGKMDARESDIVLIRSNGVKIFWGRQSNCYEELPANEKLAKIRTLLLNAGDIEDVDWNVRFPNGGILARGETATKVAKKQPR